MHSRCLHVSALSQFTFTFAFTLNNGKNGCVLQRLIRLVFVLIGLFKTIKQCEQFPNNTLYKKEDNHLRLYIYFRPTTLTCCNDLFNKISKTVWNVFAIQDRVVTSLE